MNLIRIMAWATLALSIVVATALPDPPRGAASVHGDYLVVAADFHVHAFLGDGALPPWDIAREARRRALDVVVISNHNQMLALRLYGALFVPPARPLVLPAQELTTPNFHVIALGIRETVDWRLPLGDAIRAVHAQGGLAIGAHPGTNHWQRLDDATLGSLDGLEVAHPSGDTARRANVRALYRRARQLKPTLAPIGSSDFHFGAPMGAWRTYVLVTDLSQGAVMNAIRAGRTVAYDAAGVAHGDPRWINAVRPSAAAPPPAPVDTLWHHLTMATAWLSLALLVVAGSDRGQTEGIAGPDGGQPWPRPGPLKGQAGVTQGSDFPSAVSSANSPWPPGSFYVESEPDQRIPAFFADRAFGVLRVTRSSMARRKRIQTPGLVRHVMSRGNGRMPIFLDDEDYRRFSYLLGEMVEDFEIQCWQHCVMTNHYHLALRSTRPNISEGLRHLNGTYAQWWNRKHGRPGHVFQGRFKDQIVQHERYLLTLCRYIAMNPVRAGMVEHPADWQWSSYRATAGLSGSSGFLTLAPVLAQFGDDEPHVLHTRFAQHVLQERPDEQAAIDRFRSNERIIGDKAFKTYVRVETGEIVDPSIMSSAPPPAAAFA